jgi:hypothetical protein
VDAGTRSGLAPGFSGKVRHGSGRLRLRGDLARQALLLLADDLQNGEALAALIAGSPPEVFFGVGEVALITAALVVLQTHVLFERDRGGKIHIEIEKKPTQDSLLRDLVQKLLSFFSPT